MHITVNLFATFRNGRFHQRQKEYPAGTVLGDVVASLGISAEEIGMALVNGRHAARDQPLAEGDHLSLFPLLAGG